MTRTLALLTHIWVSPYQPTENPKGSSERLVVGYLVSPCRSNCASEEGQRWRAVSLTTRRAPSHRPPLQTSAEVPFNERIAPLWEVAALRSEATATAAGVLHLGYSGVDGCREGTGFLAVTMRTWRESMTTVAVSTAYRLRTAIEERYNLEHTR